MDLLIIPGADGNLVLKTIFSCSSVINEALRMISACLSLFPSNTELTTLTLQLPGIPKVAAEDYPWRTVPVQKERRLSLVLLGVHYNRMYLKFSP